MLSRRRLFATAAATLTAPAIVRAEASRVLKFIPQSDLSVLDPVWSQAYVVRNHGMMVFDTLYGVDDTYQPRPQMAEGHRVEDDGRTWLITLRDGLAWHDGEKVLARDCVASIRRWGARDSFGQTLMAATDALDAPDDRTVRFRLKRPFPLLTAALGKAGSNVCVMMPERLAATDPFQQVKEMIGSGPFRFIAKDQVAGSMVAYERNAGYVPRPGGTPSFIAGPKIVHVDRVEWHVLPEAGTAASAMQAGEQDWWEAPTFDLLPLLRRAENLTVPEPTPLGFLGGLRFNQLQPPFNNPALRRALMGAVSQEDYMIAAATTDRRNWRAGVGIFCPQSPMASSAGMEVLTGPRDLAAVKAGGRGVRLSGREGGSARAVGFSQPARAGGRRRGHAAEGGHQRRATLYRLGQHVAEPGEDRAGGTGRVERLLHLLVGARSVRSRGACVDPRQWPHRRTRLAGQPAPRGVA